MKKLSILFLLFAIVFSAYSQSGTSRSLDKRIRFGFKIDPGSSWLGPKESYIAKDGGNFYFSYGFLADFTLTENYIIATGLNITHAGGKLVMPDGYGLNDVKGTGPATNSYQLNLQYVEIPFSLKLKTDNNNSIRYWGQFGTYLGINIGARMNATIDNVAYDKAKVSGNVVPVNMGLDLGAGIDYPLGKSTYGSFGLGFHNGFIDVTKQNSWGDGKVILNAFFLRTAVFF